MKEQQPQTPRDAARHFIRSLQRQKLDLAAMVETHPSVYHERYSATIGGTIFNGVGTPSQRFLPLAVDQIGVWKVKGEEVWGIYSLEEIYDEVWREQHGREPDELIHQGELFRDDPR